MPISLSHLAEDVFAAMTNERRAAFVETVGLGAEADIAYVESVPTLAICEAQFEPVAGRRFDGACRVDVIVRVQPGVAAAFELKLGTNRLTKVRVDDEWLTDCTPSDHDDPRWKGNVMAVLDRRFGATRVDRLFVRVGDERLELLRTWYVVARRRILNSWIESPPQFSGHVRQIAFEDVVAAFGDSAAFNRLVGRLLNMDYYREWVTHGLDDG